MWASPSLQTGAPPKKKVKKGDGNRCDVKRAARKKK